MITVVTAPPYLTVQDLGRIGYRATGVPPSGVMDVDTARTLNTLAGNPPTAAMLEWAIAGGSLRFESETTIAVGGASIIGTLNGAPIVPNIAHRIPVGSELRLERILSGRFFYVAVQGGVDVPIVLGSRSTNVVAGFGGFHGRRLRRDDVLSIGSIASDTSNIHESIAPVFARSTLDTPDATDTSDIVLRVTRGPQAALFDATAWNTFLTTTYTISNASDRMGYRLDGPALQHRGGASLVSEPTCVGAIQVPDGGTPIVLMPDGPTIGGYPKIAVLRRDDVSRFAQSMPGTPVRFTLVEGAH